MSEIVETEQREMEPAPRLTFLQDPKKHSLAKNLKKLDKVTDEALDFLAEVMRDTEVSLKDRMVAAQFVVDRKIQIATEINKDSLSRMVAEARLLMAQQPRMTPKQIEVEEVEKRPKVIFDDKTILSVEKITNL